MGRRSGERVVGTNQDPVATGGDGVLSFGKSGDVQSRMAEGSRPEGIDLGQPGRLAVKRLLLVLVVALAGCDAIGNVWRDVTGGHRQLPNCTGGLSDKPGFTFAPECYSVPAATGP